MEPEGNGFVTFPGDLATPQVVAGLNEGKVSSCMYRMCRAKHKHSILL